MATVSEVPAQFMSGIPTKGSASDHLELLHSEGLRLLQEIHGMQVLLSRMRSRKTPFLPPPPVIAPTEHGLQVMQESEAALRERNVHLARDLRGLKVLVERLRESLHGQSARSESQSSASVVVQGHTVSMPPDGSCLFHSLAHTLDGTGAHLRADIARFIASSPEAVLGGCPLKDWIEWESNQTCADYAAAMRRGGEWGGAIEMLVCSSLKRVGVHVYVECNSGFRRICEFNEVSCAPARTVAVLYRPGHYDAFLPSTVNVCDDIAQSVL
mmetsp:Transcript_4462/g.10465  ORF Transcript_4462/g.10465 Transcript_4462/m.10465 type:complete len:270 (+) Transcript_4462:41-850(+)|eukprot:CAMPEP_0171070908 /NCGR_PEP_ID=MMETSP0766_2-20121228/10022_1 /TAXON_ID=439317 /ORGANISM="Gambierdiscus australes, Strain CAWD 149" /LENGTH=269 /DNA_ID=CAMNT_0011527429 /DNA_START=28 /DNA_END=837 /DNA_ORIENTATION=-